MCNSNSNSNSCNLDDGYDGDFLVTKVFCVSPQISSHQR